MWGGLKMPLSVTGGAGPSLFGLAPGQRMSLPIWNAQPGGGGGGGSPWSGSGGGNLNMGGFDITNALVQILQQGPKASQEELNALLGDLSSRESLEKKTLADRFSGMGRPLSSTEYSSQEQQLVDAFSRARQAAQATASKTGLAQYQSQLNPLLMLLRLFQSGGLPGAGGGVGPSVSVGGGIHG